MCRLSIACFHVIKDFLRAATTPVKAVDEWADANGSRASRSEPGNS
jgi:hypothetical protein